MKKGNGGIASVSDSCTVVMRHVTIEVHKRQHICLPIDYSNEGQVDLFECAWGKCLQLHSNEAVDALAYTTGHGLPPNSRSYVFGNLTREAYTVRPGGWYG